MTSYKSIKTDVANAGAKWEDSDVVVDQGVITSRNPGGPRGVQPFFLRNLLRKRVFNCRPQALGITRAKMLSPADVSPAGHPHRLKITEIRSTNSYRYLSAYHSIHFSPRQ